MLQCNRFSIVTKNYLSRFYDILECMKEGMTNAQLNDSISHNFIVQMIPQHEAAIQMSQNLLQYTTFIPLQNIALGIISEQTQSIENMRQVLECCCEVTNSQQDLRLYQMRVDQIMRTMFREMQNAASTNDINANFMREMIPHHEGAIRMSENALSFNICPQLVPILDAIITSQKKGVREMQQLLRRR